MKRRLDDNEDLVAGYERPLSKIESMAFLELGLPQAKRLFESAYFKVDLEYGDQPTLLAHKAEYDHSLHIEVSPRYVRGHSKVRFLDVSLLCRCLENLLHDINLVMPLIVRDGLERRPDGRPDHDEHRRTKGETAGPAKEQEDA